MKDEETTFLMNLVKSVSELTVVTVDMVVAVVIVVTIDMAVTVATIVSAVMVVNTRSHTNLEIFYSMYHAFMNCSY